jgi:hypothetical protein
MSEEQGEGGNGGKDDEFFNTIEERRMSVGSGKPNNLGGARRSPQFMDIRQQKLY